MKNVSTKSEIISDNYTVTCPDCKFSEDLDVFDVCGCCWGFVICPKCSCEFKPKTGIVHKANICRECRRSE